MSSPVLVGRDAELTELTTALDRAAGGHGGLVLIEGDAGIGKSRLVDDFARQAESSGSRVVTGACLPFADAVPYAPFAHILAVLAVDGGAGTIAPSAADPSDRFRFFAWVTERLVGAASERPIVVVVEDVHWADESTGDLLLFVAAAVRTAPVLVVATRRPPGRDATSGLAVALGELVRSGRALALTLVPLADDQTADLIRLILGEEPSSGLSGRVTARAEGNPFFVEELVAAGGGEELPTTVGDLLLQRVARLDGPGREVLGIAAVIGRRVGDALLRYVVAADDAAIDHALREAVSQQLMVAAGDHYSFRHALGHEAVYGDLLPGRRRVLHHRVAVCLTAHPELALGDDRAVAAGELAHHWHAAGRLPESLAASVRAGQAAELAHAPIEAQVHYRRALDLWAQVDDAAAIAGVDRLWLLEQAAEVASLAGSHHAAVQLADQLLLELDAGREAERHARILSRRALYSWHAGDRSTSPAATEVLRGGVDSGVTLAAVTRLCGVAYQSALELRYLEALALANDALAAAREIGGPAELGHALHVTGSLQGHLGRYDDGIGQLHRSLELATEVGDKERIGSTWHNLVEAYVFAGRTEEAATLARQGVAHLQDMGLRRTYAALTAGQHALALVALGRWTEADAVGAAVLGGNVDPYFALPLNFARLQLMVRRGDDEHAERLLGDVADSFAGNAYATAVCAAWEAELALWRREWSRARAAVDRARTTIAATDEVMLELRLAGVAARVEADHFGWTRAGAGMGDLGAAVERTESAVRGAEALLTRVEEAVGGPSVPFHRSLAFARAEGARLSAPPSADPWMALLDDDGGDPYFAAYARWRAAEALLAIDVRSSKNAAADLLGRRRRRRVRWAPHRSVPRSLVWRAVPGS